MSSSWKLLANPAYAGRKPRPLRAECHDGSPFLTIRCDCGAEMHLHESQIAVVPAHVEIATQCKTCGKPLVFPPGYFIGAFAEMRAEGWIE